MFNYKDTIMSCRFIHTCHHIIAIGMYSICEVAYIGIESPTTKIFFNLCNSFCLSNGKKVKNTKGESFC